MDSPGDPHPHNPAPTDPLQEQTRRTWEARKKAMKRARWRQKREKLRQEAVALELEQGPSELQKEDPQVCQISPSGTLATGSHGHPGTPTSSPEEQEWRRRKKEMKQARKQKLMKLRQEAVALKLDQGPSKLQKEDPKVRQISPPGDLSTESHGHPETPAPTNPPEEQHRRGRPERREEKLREEAFALKLEQRPRELHKDIRQFTPGSLSPPAVLATGSPETYAPDTQDIEEQAASIEPGPARLRHSFLYSDRPRRSKRSTRVEEHVGEVSSREFEALPLDQSPPTPDSTHRPTGTTIHVRQSALYSSRLRKSHGRQEQEPSQNKPVSKECDAAGSETESEVLAEKPKDDSEFDSDEEWRKHREYKEKLLNKDFAPRSTTQAASCDKNSAVEHVTEYSGFAEWAKREYLRWQKSSLVCSEAQHTMVESSRDEPTSEVSDEDIVENANKWMSEEVMVAFNEYIGRNDKLRELKYRFKKLCHQCFNVECYSKIFHHYNFTVEVKLPSSDDWESRTYFAEVKEIFGEPYYFCCPLESDENGKCYACCNQGVNDLMHPATGGFERGLPDNVFPYM